jgi:hypothetical protein
LGRSFGDFRLSTAGKLTALGVIAIRNLFRRKPENWM